LFLKFHEFDKNFVFVFSGQQFQEFTRILDFFLSTEFMQIREIRVKNIYKIIRLYFKLSSPKLTNNPSLFFEEAK